MSGTNNYRSTRLIFTALFAALACVATVAIRIPTPGTGGYVHPGDAVVILSGIILGPTYGALAAGIGSALADILGGYFIYAPVTFVIKAVVALASGEIAGVLRKRNVSVRLLPAVLGGIVDIVIVPGGYFLAETPLYGVAAALLAVPANLIQSVGGLIISAVLCPLVTGIPDIRRFTDETYRRRSEK